MWWLGERVELGVAEQEVEGIRKDERKSRELEFTEEP